MGSCQLKILQCFNVSISKPRSPTSLCFECTFETWMCVNQLNQFRLEVVGLHLTELPFSTLTCDGEPTFNTLSGRKRG